jgi:GT2 family glycosyltransferase
MRLMPRDVPAADRVYWDGGPVDVIQGACMAIGRDHFAALRGFDEDFFLYSEEESLCERVRDAGGRAWYLPEAVVRHTWGTSTAKRPNFATEHFYRSRIVLYRKRDGRLAAAIAAVGIGVAAAASALGAVVSARSGHRSRRETQLRAALRGLRRGLTEGITSTTFWPPPSSYT